MTKKESSNTRVSAVSPFLNYRFRGPGISYGNTEIEPYSCGKSIDSGQETGQCKFRRSLAAIGGRMDRQKGWWPVHPLMEEKRGSIRFCLSADAPYRIFHMNALRTLG
ncbi:hypothetical protein [Peribacillus kribbensis]|uniref:hypothetical protein n=1 Tax=Peribacillus kribbensis TaxID=356658 RepID=UPI00047CDCCE|nr:hypothetical protein [Peribacillus kribbensis]